MPRHSNPADRDNPGAALLDDLAEFVRRFVAFPQAEAADAVALWIVHTWMMEHWYVTPRLLITAPTKRSGKTRLLEVLELFVYEPIRVINASEAAIFRTLDLGVRTLLFDEVDALFGVHAREHEDLRALINAGYAVGQTVLRVADRRTFEPKGFPVYAPVALAGIGRLPDTIEDRSIRIDMARIRPGEKVARFRARIVRKEAESLRERIEAWVATVVLPDDAQIPGDLRDREADCWEPLLRIADAAGADWPRRGRAAALALRAPRDDTDVAVQLLEHLRQAFIDLGQDRLTTDQVLQALTMRDDAPWAVWWGDDVLHGRPGRAATQLAKHLKPFGFGPKTMRFEDRTARGYDRMDALDAFQRYLGPEKAVTPETDATRPFRLNEADVPVSGVAGVSRRGTCTGCGTVDVILFDADEHGLVCTWCHDALDPAHSTVSEEGVRAELPLGPDPSQPT